MKEKRFIERKYVHTKKNPADLGSRVVKYVSLIINVGKVPNGFKIKHKTSRE